jgi:hypothetical protein
MRSASSTRTAFAALCTAAAALLAAAAARRRARPRGPRVPPRAGGSVPASPVPCTPRPGAPESCPPGRPGWRALAGPPPSARGPAMTWCRRWRAPRPRRCARQFVPQARLVPGKRRPECRAAPGVGVCVHWWSLHVKERLPATDQEVSRGLSVWPPQLATRRRSRPPRFVWRRSVSLSDAAS